LLCKILCPKSKLIHIPKIFLKSNDREKNEINKKKLNTTEK